MIKEEKKIKFICDNCGKEETLKQSEKVESDELYNSGFKNEITLPNEWKNISGYLFPFFKIDDGEIIICSKECLEEYIDKNQEKIKEHIINNVFNKK